MQLDSQDPDLSIRLLTQDDLESLYTMYMNGGANPYLTFDPMPLESFAVIFQELEASKTVYIASLNEQIVGSYRIIRKTHRQAHCLYLGSFVVHQDMKGRGIGSKILRQLLSSAEDQGIIRVELTVDIDNEAAIRLYLKCGFQVEGRIQMSYKRSPENRYFDEYLMARVIPITKPDS